MKWILEAACACNTGRIRRNNEDNFFFDGRCLEADNMGLRNVVSMEEPLKNGTTLAIFDGMGGESFGEQASFVAARQMQRSVKTLSDFFIPEKNYLERLTAQLNAAVCAEAKALCAGRMGTTVVCLYFSGRFVYVCNVGDSRAYRLRGGEFMQISKDHVDSRPGSGKPLLTQHLGIDPEEMQIEPYIAKGEIKRADRYLLCSDGLTDMLTNFEISDIMMKSEDAAGCAEALVQAALERGGKDNITAIVCVIA